MLFQGCFSIRLNTVLIMADLLVTSMISAFFRLTIDCSSSMARSFVRPRGKVLLELNQLSIAGRVSFWRMALIGSIILTRSSTTASACLFFDSAFSSSLISLTIMSSSSSPLLSNRFSSELCFCLSLNCWTKREIRPQVTKQLSSFSSPFSVLKAISNIFCML